MSSELIEATHNALVERAFVTLSNSEGFYNGMVPDLGFNAAMAAIFGLFVVFYAVFAFPYKQWWFSACFVIFTTMELIGYIARAISHGDIYSKTPYIIQYTCLTLAPVLAMAGIYYQFAKLIMVYGPEYSRLKPMYFSYIFVACDVIAIFVQGGGGTIASGGDDDASKSKLGSRIFLGGLVFQVVCMTIFLGLYFDFLYTVYYKAQRNNPNMRKDDLYNPEYKHIRASRLFKYFNIALTASILLIFVRCCYRVAELSEGWEGYLLSHEIYFVILDAAMVSIATLILAIFYPGFVFDGRHTTIAISRAGRNMVNPSDMNDDARDVESDFSVNQGRDISHVYNSVYKVEQ